MKQMVVNAIGLLAGLVGGFVLAPEPILATFSPAHVTWDGSACPTGAYTITATANNLNTGEAFQTTSANVQLPSGNVGQDFPDLSPGTYSISARAVTADGRSFQSKAQQLTIGVSPTLPTPTPTPTPAPVDGSARQRPLTSPSQGTALPRLTGSSNNLGGGRSSNEIDAPATAELQAQVSVAWVLQTLDHLQSVAHGGASVVRDLSIVDEDGDGTVDYVRAIVGGRVRIWRIAR